MDDFSEIEKVMGDIGLDAQDDASNYEAAINISGTNENAILKRRVEALTSENMELARRLSSVEAKVQAMYTEFVKPRERPRIQFPDENTIRDTYVRPSGGLESSMTMRRDSDSYVDVNEARSDISGHSVNTQASRRRFSRRRTAEPSPAYATPSPSPRITQGINPFSMYAEASDAGGNMFKSNSVVAPQGYVTKQNVWGTGLASFLEGAMRYYIVRKNAGMLMVDRVRMASVYSKLVNVLYESFMTKPLPPVSSPLTIRLSKSISRTVKGEVPESEARTWSDLERTQEGRDIMVVIKLMLSSAKRVPEAMVHPVSQLIPYLDPLPVQLKNGEPVFAINSNVEVSAQPNPEEAWCTLIKDAALVKYVKYRISDMTAPQTIARMTNEMKLSELAEKKNWAKITKYNATMSAD